MCSSVKYTCDWAIHVHVAADRDIGVKAAKLRGAQAAVAVRTLITHSHSDEVVAPGVKSKRLLRKTISDRARLQ